MEGSSTESSSHDPYYVVQGELQTKIAAAEPRAARFVHLLETTDTCTNAEFRELRRALTKEVKAADAQLKDLRTTVDYVERDRATFAHIDDAELESRRAWVSEAKGTIDGFKVTLTGDKVKEKLLADEKKALAASAPGGDATLGARNQREFDNTRFVQDQQAQQRVQMREQDESVLELEGAVTRIHAMGKEINGARRASRAARSISDRARARALSRHPLAPRSRAQGPERDAGRGRA